MFLFYLFLICSPIAGLVFAFRRCLMLSKVKVEGPEDVRDKLENGLVCVNKMKEISNYISKGANVFLKKTYKYLSIFIVIFWIILVLFTGKITAFSFLIGCLTSVLCGFIGMKIATYVNVRTINETWKGLDRGFEVTLNGGIVVGLSSVSLSILSMCILIFFYKKLFDVGVDNGFKVHLLISGYGLGASVIALFSRVGGGIYTKAVNVGADLSNKNEYGIPDDDIRNPACIADTVGDNVSNIVGLGSDLFGSLAESLCAVLIIGSNVLYLKQSDTYYNLNSCIYFPLLSLSMSILVGIATYLIVMHIIKIVEKKDIEIALRSLIVLSTIMQTMLIIILGYMCIPKIIRYNIIKEIQRWKIVLPFLLGLWSCLIICFSTEFYTSYIFKPVQNIANKQKISAATGIIYGFSLGYQSTVIPIICLSITLGISYNLCELYGIALAAVGMLSTLCMCLSIEAYGPMSVNADGISEIAGLPLEVKTKTNMLDEISNTTISIGKGYSITSATLTAFALLSAYASVAQLRQLNILNSWVLMGILIGAMLPYIYTAFTIKSVTMAADSVLTECLLQLPLILSDRQKPDYEKCIDYATDVSLKMLIVPGLLSIFVPLLVGFLFGKYALAGLLIGIILSGTMLAFSSTHAGSAWENAKKYIESGGLGTEFSKGSDAHKNSIIGNIVGSPLKDTSGPSLNILIKLSAITSLVFAHYISVNFTSRLGGSVFF
ncbi:V-type H(+)-translocating pyrophosphatase, putative [Hepatocystis sp. ex Piliocolobus tephrosceles]|nr:V-type H(+)-translocating pyrophosphatase, putative [Hepatocystis sp. ex Piliocolobus tephrosceles]